MADDLNTFPLVLAIREDGSVDSVVDSFERGFGAATTRVASGFEAISRNVRALQQQATQKIADPLGIKAQLQSLSSSPLQKVLSDQSSAENALAQQRARESAARVTAINRGFEAAMSGIRAEQAARTAAFAVAQQQGAALVSLDQQRIAEMAQRIAAPRQVSFGFDASGIEASAQAARIQADQLDSLAAAAERSRDRMAAATLTDRAYADGAREAADAARLEAQRLTELAATQGRVAAQRLAPKVDQRSGVQRLVDGDGSIDRAVLSAATLDGVLARVADRTAGIATNTERARIEQEKATLAAQAQADAMARQVAEAARLVAGPQQQPSTLYFDPQGSAQAATSARAQAVALAELARNAETVAVATRNATAADRAFAVTARDAASAAAIEADRLEQVAATQGRVAAAGVAAGGKFAAAGDLVTNSVRGQRFATIQASQQFQDFFIQIQGGQSPLVAFSQQASQLAFVMANTGGETGKFARFIGGPWGTLIFAGLSVLTLLTAGLFDNKKASKAAEDGAKAFADRQGDLKSFIDQTTGALVEQNKTLVLNAVLTRQAQIAENNKSISEGRKAALKAANKSLSGNTGQLNQGTGDAPVLFRQDPDVQNAVRAAKGDIDALSISIARLAQTKRPDLKALALDISNQAGEAIFAARENKKLNEELAALRGNTNASVRNSASLQGLVAISAATDKYTGSIETLKEKRRQLSEGFDRDVARGKGDANSYTAAAAAIDKQIAAQQKLKSEAEKAGRSGDADAKRVAGQRRQELFADAAAIGDGTDAIRSANSTYAAEITRLRNQLREGLISDDVARDSAVKARQVRNAAIEAAQGAKTLDAALQRIGQEFDGDSRFVNRIEKAQAAVAEALKRIDATTRTAQIGENEYSEEDLLERQRQLREAMLRPISDATRQLGEQAEIDAAILSGREDEADFLRLKFQILQQYEELTTAERAALEAQLAPLRGLITAEKDRNVEIERRSQLINAQVAAARRVQDALTNFIEKPFAKGSLTDLSKSLAQSRQKQIAEELSIKLFGDMGSDVYRALTRNNQPTVEAAGKLSQAARDLTEAASRIGSATAANDNPSIAQRTTTPSAFGLNPGLNGGGAYTDPLTGDIVVNASRGGGQGSDRDPFAYDLLGEIGKAGSNIGDLGKAATRQASIQQAATVGLSFAAQAIGGKAGKAINAGLNIAEFSKAGEKIAKQIGGGLGKTLGGAVQGLGIGQAVGSIYELLGVKGAGTGSAVGGAIGGAAFGPLGAIGGAVIGGGIGALLYKPKTGSASLSQNGVSVSGNNADYRAAAQQLGNGVIASIDNIVQQLGGTLGNFAVSIGKRDDRFVVDESGRGSTKYGKANDGITAYKTEAEASAAALRNAILDGAVAGIRAGSQALLRAGTDLERQLQKAMSFENVFRELKALKDPIGAANDDINRQLEALRKTFNEAGATAEERAQLEELYSLKRADAVKQAQEQLTGQLQSLLNDLRYKGDSGLSLRTRESNALTALNPLIAQIQSGKAVDQSAFSEAARAYLDIERQLYGSTQTYFEKLAQITNLTALGITNTGASNVVPISEAVRAAMAPASAAAIAALVPPVDTASIVAAVREQTAAMNAINTQTGARFDLLTRVVSNSNRSFELQIAEGSPFKAIQALRNA